MSKLQEGDWGGGDVRGAVMLKQSLEERNRLGREKSWRRKGLLSYRDRLTQSPDQEGLRC